MQDFLNAVSTQLSLGGQAFTLEEYQAVLEHIQPVVNQTNNPLENLFIQLAQDLKLTEKPLPPTVDEELKKKRKQTSTGH